MKTVCVPLAQGFEEIEAITIIDVLRRANLKVTTASLSGSNVTGAHGVVIQADTTINNIYNNEFDAIVLPGGMPGTTNLLESKELKEMLQRHNSNSKVVAAICAAPWVLSEAEILNNKTATCYPSFEEKFNDSTQFSKQRIVEDNNVLTSRGPGTAMEFSLALVRKLVDNKTAEDLKNGLLSLA